MARFRAKRDNGSAAHDAYWQIPSAEYVPSGTLPPRRPLDDRSRVADAWSAAVDTLRREAHEPESVRARIAHEVKQFDQDFRRQQARREPDDGTAEPAPSTPARRPWTFLMLMQTLRKMTLHRR
ncbi:hypothetical protein [Jidongwangia harbinensis]|uniref:hypothetical protein n=1 Tax=Jidongwangia harbinensis TaxID=2878561 RepID=UPI001CD9677B|nr:hypothetical protein [Jidongwangia harbinensis]MCA2218103.1 hypothetical protein [Jidongwangia harbinensis]